MANILDEDLTLPYGTQAVTNKHIADVIKQLGPDDLKKLFHALNLEDKDIEKANEKAGTRDVDLRAREVFKLWRQKRGKNVTTKTILDAMEDCEFREEKQDLMQEWITREHSDAPFRGFDLKQCQEQLRLHYLQSLCKIPLFPGDYENCVNLKDIYTKISISINLPSPCRPVKIPLTSIDELFTRKTDEGLACTKTLISASAGLGKTTVTAKIAYDWATKLEESPLKDIPLVFVLNMRWIDHTSDLEEAILAQLLPEDTSITREHLQSTIKKLGEKVVIILDAVDESDRELYDHPDSSGSIVKLLTGRILVTCRLIVTTRPWRATEVARACSSFTRFELNGFTKDDVKNYVRKFFRQDEDSRDSLLHYMKQNELIADVAAVPLMALLICLYWCDTENAEIPNRITYLYDAVVNIMHQHRLSKQKAPMLHPDQLARLRTRLGKTTVSEQNRSSELSVSDVDVQSLMIQLGIMALEGLWPPQNRLVFSPDEAHDIEVVEKACQIGLITMQQPRLGTRKRMVLSRQKKHANQSHKEGATGISLPHETHKITFFHKSGQEKCAGEYLASLVDDNPEELASYLSSLQNVKEILSIQLILRFASGVTLKAAEAILKTLMEIFYTEIQPKISRYYSEDLDFEDAMEIQQFIELCLACNYEVDVKDKFNALLVGLFPKGQVHFLGISTSTAVALGYYLSYAQPNDILLIRLRPVVHARDAIESVGPLNKIQQHAQKVVKQMPLSKLQAICRDYLKSQATDVHESNQWLAANSPVAMVSSIQMWQACQCLPTAEESNINSIISSLRCIRLQKLDITGFKIGDTIDQLLEAINDGYLGNMLNLTVSNIGMNEHQMKYLAIAIKKTPYLRELDISRNTAGQSIATFAESLPLLTSLQVLCIHNMHQVTAPAWIAFVQKFPKFGSSLAFLKIHGNYMNDEIASHFAEQLPTARLLSKLTITVVGLSRKYHNRLISALCHLSLTHLQISGSDYPNDLMVSVTDIMDVLPDLCCLHLFTSDSSSSRVSSTTWQVFRAKFQTLTKLRGLNLHNIALEKDDFLDLVSLCREKELSSLWYLNEFLQ